MPEGFLRDSVEVTETSEYITLSHPCWTLDLPRQWAERTDGIMDFLRRRRPLESGLAAEAADLVRLLSTQGCLTFSEQPVSYSLREVYALFRGIRNEWCGYYYRHPLWDMLRTGELPEPRFIAWAVYNYFLSRSAGISASRFVAFSEKTSLRASLARSMIEEYSHFSDYYHIRHKDLNVPAEDIEQYVQLPSSTAFCQQMLRMAEEDWLGHILIAYFQESTVQFYRDCFKFYAEVEASYGIKGFFKPWQDHIRVDIDCLHAESIEEQFDSDERIPTVDLQRSLSNAWFAYRMLLSALDEIAYGLGEVDGEWRRRSIRATLAELEEGILLPKTRVTRTLSLTPCNTLAELAKQVQVSGLANRQGRSENSDRDNAFLRSDIIRSTYRALSFADDATSILALGKLAEDAGVAVIEPAFALPATADAMAIANFLRELAMVPQHFCFSIYCLANPSDANPAPNPLTWLPISDNTRHELAKALATMRADAAGPILTKFIQLLELVERWQGNLDLPSLPNFFTGTESRAPSSS